MMTTLAEFDSANRRLTRKSQIRTELGELRSSLDNWLKRCRDSDFEDGVYIGRHESQLKAVQTVLLSVLTKLDEHAIGLDLGNARGVLHAECRRLTEALVWFERLWIFVASKFDQRFGDGPQARLLRAADEVVWSCYRPVVNKLPPSHPARQRATAPLAYVEAEYSPAAVQFDRPLPPGLRLTSDEQRLDRLLDRMPLATVRIPPWCVSGPWWLVFVAHEVGHHVQHELSLVRYFSDGIGRTAREAGLTPTSVRLWEAWSEEVFADAFSVMTLGPWAVRAVTEIEWGPEETLTQRKVHYPAPVIRVALMTELARRLSLDTSALVDQEELAELAARSASISEDWRAIVGIVDFVLQPLPNGLSLLRDLCDFKAEPFAPRNRVDIWAAALRGEGQLTPDRTLPGARLMVSAAMSAWVNLAGSAESETKGDGWRRLVDNATTAVHACAESGKRAAGQVATSSDAGAEIAALLLLMPVNADVAGAV